MRLTNPNQQVKYSSSKPSSKRYNSFATPKPTNKYRAAAIALAGISLLLLGGCQSAPIIEQTSAPVIPRENATFDTYGKGRTNTEAVADAMRNAEITCRKYENTRVIVTKDEVTYNGVGSEKTGAMIDKASKVIGILSGKKLPDAVSEDDYEAKITFKCVTS